MAELCHAHRIYQDTADNVERVVPISFKWDDILDIRSSKGVGLPFENKEPKVLVNLTGGRGFWLIVPISKFRQQWEAYLSGAPCWDFTFSKQ